MDMDDPISRLIGGVVLLFFAVLLLPVAVLVFIATFALMAGLAALLGSPTGALASVLGIAWFGGSLALVFLICVLAYRKVPFIRRTVDLSEHIEKELLGTSSVADVTPAGDPQANPETLRGRVAAADAWLADLPPTESSPGASESV